MKIKKYIFTSILTIIFLYISYALIFNSIFSFLFISQSIIHYLSDIEMHPWIFRFSLFSGFKICILSIQIWFIYQLISSKPRIDTYDLKWVQLPALLTFIASTANLLLRYLSGEAEALLNTIRSYEQMYYYLIFTFILYIGQNYLGFFRKRQYSKHIILLSNLPMFYFWWNYIARAYQKHRLLDFLSSFYI